LQLKPEKGEISGIQEDSSPLRLHPLAGEGRRKEKFPKSKKILLLHWRPGVWPWPEKGEISGIQEDSSPSPAAGRVAAAGKWEAANDSLSTLTRKFKQGIIEKSGRSRPIAAACDSALHKQR